MDFELELEELLRKYVPVTNDRDHYSNIITLLQIKIEKLHNKYKEK